jgi:hypothetical protein
MSGKRRRRRLSKKEYERLEREIADLESKARAESQARQERINVLWGLNEQDPKERKLNRQKLKEQKLKKLLNCIKDLAENDELADQLEELVELAGLQDREIGYLTQFRRELERIRAHYPEKLENLSSASMFAEMKSLIEALSAKEKPKKAWERKRGGYRRWPGTGVGLIEYEFGGAAEAERRKPLSSLYGLPDEPTCLDEIFAGGTVRMRSEDVALNPQPSGPLAPFLSKTQHKAGLEELFGMERHRFGNGLRPIEKGRETWYNYRTVVKIMDRLLSEEPREDKTPRRGKTPRLWPSNPSLRIRVLIGIHERMQSVSVSEDMWGAFTAVVCFHLTKGIEGRLSEDVKNARAALVRRYLA